MTAGELEITDTLTIDGSTGVDVTITGDALGDDELVDGTFITDVAASLGESPFGFLLDDNSRVLNFSSSMGDLSLSGLTLTGGRPIGPNLFMDKAIGGSIRFWSIGSLSLTDSAVCPVISMASTLEQSSDEKSNRRVQHASYDPSDSPVSSELGAAEESDIVSSSADLFDSWPEFLDEIDDVEVDDIFEDTQST